MRKLISTILVTLLVAACLALMPGLALADESTVTSDVGVSFDEEATVVIMPFAFSATAQVHSACVTSGTISATNGLMIVDQYGGGFYEADFAATLDGRNYSGAMKGSIYNADTNSGVFEMWGKFYDNNHNYLEGRYHIQGNINTQQVELVRIEITWKDDQQCYCDLTVDSIQFATQIAGPPQLVPCENIVFSVDGDSTGTYNGSFDGLGYATIYDVFGSSGPWSGKGYVNLFYGTETGAGEIWAYAQLVSGPSQLPYKGFIFLGAIFETSPVGIDGSVDWGVLKMYLDSMTGRFNFHVRHTNSGPCALAPTPAPTIPSGGGGGGGGGGFCFIATAAYGSYLDSHVDTLRSFRDQYLETNPIGSAFVSLYYKVSPPMADFIDEHPTLKPIVRAGLWPAVAMSSVALNTTLAEKAVILIAMALFAAVLIKMWLMRRTRRLERR